MQNIDVFPDIAHPYSNTRIYHFLDDKVALDDWTIHQNTFTISDAGLTTPHALIHPL